MSKGLEIEAKGLGDLVVTPESKALVHIFYLTESAGKLGKGAKDDLAAAKVGVIGGGTMGAGIAASFLSKRVPVVLFDLSEEARDKAKAHIHGYINKRRGLSESDKDKLKKQLSIVATLDGISDTTLIVEAIVEDMKVKKEVFKKLEVVVSEETVLASNTSSLSIDEISSAVDHPERVVGMHFFNPAEKMPLVELIRGEKTSDKTVIYGAALSSKLGKYPVVVEDVRGFLVNRLLSPYLVEAAHLLAEGVPAKIIDKVAVKFGMPMGPLRLLDEVGLDVASKVNQIMVDAYGDRMEGPRFAEQLVSLGRYGKKSGQGFYLHEGKKATLEPMLTTLLDLPPRKEESQIDSEEIKLRLMLPMVNEAVRSLDEGVAGVPGKDAAGQIDLATVMGTGFAPFRGGVLYFANSLGVEKIASKLKSFEVAHGKRFAPAEGIVSRAKKKEGFFS